MNERENVILLDSAPQPEWNFRELLERETGKRWNIWHINSHFSDSSLKKKAKFFLFPLKVLFHRPPANIPHAKGRRKTSAHRLKTSYR